MKTQLFLLKLTSDYPINDLESILAELVGNKIEAYSFDAINTPNINNDYNNL